MTASLRLRLLSVFFLGGCLLWWWQRPPSAAVQFYEISGQTMGTSFAVKYRAPAGDHLVQMAALQKAIYDDLERVSDMASTYRSDSELSRFNAFSDVGQWYEVSSELARLAAEALRIHTLSEGTFDPSVGELVRLWGFGPGDRPQAPPSRSLLAQWQARQHPGYEVQWEPKAAIRKLEDGGLSLDFSGIAKGDAVDRLARLLEDHGIHSYLIEIGGELRSRRHGRQDPGWRVGIEVPAVGAEPIRATMPDGALATSGSYRNFYDLDGERIGHVLDPRTGSPSIHRILSVSVFAPRCLEADALATGLFVHTLPEIERLSRENNWAVLVLHVPEGASQWAVWTSPDFVRAFPNLGSSEPPTADRS